MMITEEDKTNYRCLSIKELQKRFYFACEFNDIEAIKFMLEDSEIKVKPDLDGNQHNAFWEAHLHKNKELINYYLYSPLLEKNANVQKLFYDFIVQGSHEITMYLLDNFEIKINKAVIDAWENSYMYDIKEMKRKMDRVLLQNKLANELDEKSQSSRMKL